MIRKFPYSLLSLENLITLSIESIKIIKNNHKEEQLFSKSLIRLQNAIEKAQKGVGKTQKEALTLELAQADAKRDDNFRGIRDHIEAGLNRHRNLKYQKACEYLDKMILKHGKDLYKSSYPEENTRLNKLLKELKTPKTQKNLQTVHLIEWVAELQLDQDYFEEVFTRRNNQKAAKDTLTDNEAIKLLKPELQKFYILVDAFYIDDTVIDIEKSINEINSTIDRIIKSAKRS